MLGSRGQRVSIGVSHPSPRMWCLGTIITADSLLLRTAPSGFESEAIMVDRDTESRHTAWEASVTLDHMHDEAQVQICACKSILTDPLIIWKREESLIWSSPMASMCCASQASQTGRVQRGADVRTLP